MKSPNENMHTPFWISISAPTIPVAEYFESSFSSLISTLITKAKNKSHRKVLHSDLVVCLFFFFFCWNSLWSGILIYSYKYVGLDTSICSMNKRDADCIATNMHMHKTNFIISCMRFVWKCRMRALLCRFKRFVQELLSSTATTIRISLSFLVWQCQCYPC